MSEAINLIRGREERAEARPRPRRLLELLIELDCGSTSAELHLSYLVGIGQNL